MSDLLLQIAGGLAVAISLIHGVLGETKIFAKAKIEPAWIKLMLRFIWQCSTLAWISCGVLLIAAPYLGAPARGWIVAISVINFLYAAAGNAWATRFRHIGWVAMTLASGLAIAGL
ncbi:MAG: hypothetical protein ABI439_03660 [Rhodospirillales bacterium]